MNHTQNMNGLWKTTWAQKQTRKLHEVSLGALPRIPVHVREHTQDVCMLTDFITETYELSIDDTFVSWVMHGTITTTPRATMGYDVEIQYTTGKLFVTDPYTVPYQISGYADRCIDLTYSNRIFSVIVMDSSGRIDRDPCDTLVYLKKVYPSIHADYII